MLKNNWNESVARYRAFWAHQPVDRSPVFFGAVGPYDNPMYNGAGYDYQKYGEDIESYCQDYVRVWEARVDCHDDTIPCITPEMGGAHIAAMWAGELDWGREMAHLKPHNPLADVKRLADITFDPSNGYYRRTLREVAVLSSLARGRYGVNLEPDLSVTTTISQLRGGTQFCLDVLDDPEGLRAFAERITDQMISLYAEVDRIIPRPAGGTCHRWLNYWNPGRGFWFSEDDAIMMSPAVYRDMFLDLDRRLCASTDYPVLHWHTGSLHLVDEFLKIEDLRMIQISPDPNGPSLEDVLNACQRMEAVGCKILFQAGYDESFVEAVFAKLRPDSCMFYFGSANSIDHANAIVHNLERLCQSCRKRKRAPA